MIIQKIAILFFFVLRCYLSTNIESKNIIILNDEIKTIKSPIHCINEIYFLFQDELYKTCIQHVIRGRTEIHVLIQKQINSTWETQAKLFEDKLWFHVPSVFNFVLDDEIIIVICRYKSVNKKEGATCERWKSVTGTTYKKESLQIGETFANKNIDSYASVPLKISKKKFLLICGIHSYEYQDSNKDNFISCIASEDKGATWRTQIHINYEQFKKGIPYFYLRPLIFDDEFGFYFFSRISTINTGRGGNYMTCTPEATNEYKFICKDVNNLIKENKSLQNITKLSGYYITSYVKKDNFNECYLYYTEHNAIVVKPKVQNYDLNGCYGGSFVKLDEEDALFIYSTGHGVQNIHTLHYTRYD
ncbi:hypothetical protein PCYB_053730 [Plasmodium cynomolgi strain B]|uniref:Cysteine-rich protective antigen 6 bladed domain-containing protein n=1 Tax=Plasmodium cynomolgi (strain B) TaxID=1120755 RepID=K6UTD1_PLACD|nr:hypothetical protein PCYB_053730 [Plasmodium cynomolgi strain B]GAB65355.1 hypothetical protein PCYB_053730 [Plasmodium cynomolgi strain B]